MSLGPLLEAHVIETKSFQQAPKELNQIRLNAGRGLLLNQFKQDLDMIYALSELIVKLQAHDNLLEIHQQVIRTRPGFHAVGRRYAYICRIVVLDKFGGSVADRFDRLVKIRNNGTKLQIT